MAYVYLLQELDFNGQPTGLYKIGQTKKDVESRKKQYQAGNARQVVEFYAIFVDDSQYVETQLHRYFVDERTSFGGGDEWFYFPDISTVMSTVIEVMDKFSEGSLIEEPQLEEPHFKYQMHTSRYTERDIEDDFPWGWIIGIIVAIGLFTTASQQRQNRPESFSAKQADLQDLKTYFPIASRAKIVQRANVRERALPNSNLLAIAEVGDIAIVQETYGAWIRLKFKSGVDGWVYVKTIEAVR